MPDRFDAARHYRFAAALPKDERLALLRELRVWLENSQRILAATPGSLFRKIPVEIKALGFDTRRKFDASAAEAAKSKDGNRIVSDLSVAMGNCIACHATYRFVEK